MASIEPYTISVPDSKLQQLHDKLEAAKFPDELDAAGWDYGAPLADVKRLTAFWKNQYDWRMQEEKLNQLPNFKAVVSIDGFGTLDIHFVHQKSEVQEAIPLLFCHGCQFSCLPHLDLADSQIKGLEASLMSRKSSSFSSQAAKTTLLSTLLRPPFLITVSLPVQGRKALV